jgi:Ca2+-transporting ATPase
VAREASSLVLLDDHFASIVAAIRSGRRIFDNMQKAMFYILAIHVPIVGLTLLPAFDTTLPLLLMPLHIVFLELIIDPVCSIAFEYEQEEKGIMQRPPRDPREAFFGGRRIFLSTLEGLLLLGMVVSVYMNCLYEGHTEGETRAITFSALIIGNIFLILTNLSRTRSFLAVLLEGNLAMMIILSLALVMMFMTITIPAFQRLFNFEFPGHAHFFFSAIAATGMLFILEAIKFIFKKRSPLPPPLQGL